MGLFSSKKTYVSSTLYNLAGDELERPNYLKSLVVGNIIANNKFSVSDTLQAGYAKGAGMQMRNFFRWAEDNYGGIGVPTGSLGGRVNLDYSIVGEEIPHDPGEDIQVQYVEIGIAEYSYWAEQWLFNNYPELIDTAWTSDFNETTGEIDITFADLSSASFEPVGFDKAKVYVYAAYSIVSSGGSEPVEPGDEVVITPATDPFPSTTGWTLISNTTTTVGADTQQVNVYEKTEYMGQDPDPATDLTYSIKSTRTDTELRDPADVILSRKYQIDTQKLIHGEWSSVKMFIYEIGSGNAVLDGLVMEELDDGEYLPFIPIRLNNQFLSESYEPASYILAKKAFRKASGQNLDKIIDKIADNEELDQIDYAYVMYGVSLNCLEVTAREYLYRFFDKLRLSQTTSNVEYALWEAALTTYDDSVVDWNLWKIAQGIPSDPLYGTPEPVLGTRPAKPENFVHIKSNGSLNTNVDMKISWQIITETTGTGLKKPDAKKGEIWLEDEPNPAGSDYIYSKGGVFSKSRDDLTTFSINWQIDEDSWKTLTIVGAIHENLIYNGKSVKITAKEALEDDEESGFLVPIHYATMREMRLVDSTQMCTACTFIVFNSYKVVKKKWYQTGIFKIFIFIAIIALMIVFPPLGGAALSTFASIGAVVGLTGIAGILVGAVVMQLVTMIVMKIVGKLSTEIFGKKFGAIFAAVFTFVVMTVGMNMTAGASLSAAWGNMMSASNLLQLTMATANGISGYMAASAQGFAMKSQELMEDYSEKSKEISELFAQNFGYGNGSINPLGLTDVTFGNPAETEQMFLTRTLMTGTDIAELSHQMLANFSELTTSTDLPLNE